MIHIEHRGFVFSALLACAITLTACGTESGSGISVNAEKTATISQALEAGSRVSVDAPTLEESDSARLKTDPNSNMRPYVLPPSFGPTIPTIDSISPNAIDAGVATEIVLRGQSFINTVTEQNKTYDPTIVLSPFDADHSETESYVLQPSSVTQSEVRFTATLPAGIHNLRVYKDHNGSMEVKSNDLPIVVRPKVTIDSAAVCNGTVTIRIIDNSIFDVCRGNPNCIWVAIVTIPCPGCPVISQACAVSNWSNQGIVATCPNATIGAQANVRSLFGSASAILEAGCK